MFQFTFKRKDNKAKYLLDINDVNNKNIHSIIWILVPKKYFGVNFTNISNSANSIRNIF